MEKTCFDFGVGYGKWLLENNEPCLPVDYEATRWDIPIGDYCEMKRAGIEPNEREYWAGYNSVVEQEEN